MPRRGRKRKIKLKIRTDTLHSSVSIGLLVLAGVFLISFFAPSYAVNDKIQDFLIGTFGYPSFLLPFILAIAGLIYSRTVKWRFVELRVLVGLAGMLFGLAPLFSLIGIEGGSVGDTIADFLKASISGVGGFIVLVAVVLISIIFLFDVSITDAVNKIRELFGKMPIKKKKEGEKDSKKATDSKGDKASKEDDIEITSGTNVINAAWADKEAAGEAKEEFPEPSFEVVPSMSEPQKPADAVEVSGDSAEVKTLAGGLPYADRVWEPPPLDLLAEPLNTPVDRGDVKVRAQIIVDTLKSFGVNVRVEEINFGPAVTQYALEKTDKGTKIAKIANLQYDLAMALASPTGSIRIEAPIPGKNLIGIEVPNTTRVNVYLKEMISSDLMKSAKSKRSIVLGRDVGGMPVIYDIAKMPHLLVAGATGSGKSVFLHTLIMSILYRCSPEECKLILIDPKRVELVHYGGIPHLLTPVVTDTQKASSVFKWAIQEMERRYKLLESAKVRNIDSYNEKSGFQAMPYIVIVVDELAEIMIADPALVEKSIIRLAQLARAVGIHLVLTVQRPSTNVITGLIKANIPCRVAFNVASQVDSRVIIDQPGAEKLLGKGDMLFVPPDVSKPIRIQGAFISEKEIAQVANHLKSAGVAPEYKEEIFEAAMKEGRSVSSGGTKKDALFDEAIEVVVSSGKASASLLQRRLSIGYARAARILDELEVEGIVGPSKGSKPRDILRKQEISPIGDVGEEVVGKDVPQPF